MGEINELLVQTLLKRYMQWFRNQKPTARATIYFTHMGWTSILPLWKVITGTTLTSRKALVHVHWTSWFIITESKKIIFLFTKWWKERNPTTKNISPLPLEMIRLVKLIINHTTPRCTTRKIITYIPRISETFFFFFADWITQRNAFMCLQLQGSHG